MTNDSTLAVVDAWHDDPVVWWVSTSTGTGIARLSGAWVLADRLRQHLGALTQVHRVIATDAGTAVLAHDGVEPRSRVDLPATQAAVATSRDELRAAVEGRPAATKAQQAIKWPDFAPGVDIETLSAQAGDPAAARALGIAHWLVKFCDDWQELERLRLSRAYLRPLGGPAERSLPWVLCDASAAA